MLWYVCCNLNNIKNRKNIINIKLLNMSKKGNNNVAGVLAGLLAGAAAGVVLGMLYAPEEGAETRKKIKSKAKDLKDQAADKYCEVSEKAKNQFHQTAEKAKETYRNVSDTVRDTAEKVAHNVKDGYDKYKDQAASKVADVSKDVENELNSLKS